MTNPYEVMQAIFSKGGFKLSDFYIKVENETSVDIYRNKTL